ncbi:40S ribosomal protein S21 [Trypanosoma cruzi cruzi]|uniref:Putative 40S ribosomal protein S21 n=1 Tax=Trypanosoma cruzi TaxID=5693 RepID=A0A2V2UKQ3_TRYCR|nr:40S ribosomal protein S21 [Trypanosoma cruzi cruzi]PWU84630.1 putative 40S ribosomal protein S21 [Trypanosoma cruzi]7ASE_g Chain g, Putative 40S ribosomal protein S21 [Trypanosoma cruzi]
MTTIGTYNEEGVNVDLYIPRKCHATNNLITSYDHSAVQIAIANVDANGVLNGTTTTFCIAGYLRRQAESDHAINHLAISKGIIRIKTGKKPRAKKLKNVKGLGVRGLPRGALQQRGARALPTQRGIAQRGGAQKGNVRKLQPQQQKQRSQLNQRSQQQKQRPQQQHGARPTRKEEGGRMQRGVRDAPQARKQQGRDAPQARKQQGRNEPQARKQQGRNEPQARKQQGRNEPQARKQQGRNAPRSQKA